MSSKIFVTQSFQLVLPLWVILTGYMRNRNISGIINLDALHWRIGGGWLGTRAPPLGQISFIFLGFSVNILSNIGTNSGVGTPCLGNPGSATALRRCKWWKLFNACVTFCLNTLSLKKKNVVYSGSGIVITSEYIFSAQLSFWCTKNNKVEMV